MNFRIIFAVVFIAIVVMIGFRFMMVSRALSNGKAIYEITITGNERGEVYLATEIIKQENGCSRIFGKGCHGPSFAAPL